MTILQYNLLLEILVGLFFILWMIALVWAWQVDAEQKKSKRKRKE